MPKDVHPQIQQIIDRTAELGIPPLSQMETGAARELVENMARARLRDYPAPPLAAVSEASTGPGFGHVPVRIYRPEAAQGAPAIVFFHGGGHVIGSLDSHDTVARMMALKSGAVVISVDYRMGPEHPFPAAVEDAFNALRWTFARHARLEIDPARIAVSGDSAGGNLAAVAALLAREAGLALSAQALVYPVIDYRGGTPSYDRYGTGYGILDRGAVDWFRERYLPDPAHHDDWRAAPHLAESLAGLAPALVLLAECDVLVEEGRRYAEALAAAGVPTEVESYAGMTHGFFGYLGLADAAEAAHERLAAFLKGRWAGQV